jgi:hypothetical protein
MELTDPKLDRPAHPPPHERAPASHRYTGHRRPLLLDAEGLRVMDTRNDTSFIPLMERLSSLLHQDAFPKLQFLRDLSGESYG